MRNFFVSIRKTVTSAVFPMCAVMVVVLMFTSDIYYDYGSNAYYSVFRALTDFTREELTAEFEFCSVNVIKNAQGAWFRLFAPIVAGFCFVPTICSEREEKAARFQIFRTNKLNYHISQFLAGVVSGGLAIALGFVIFAAAAAVLFPGADKMSQSAALMIQQAPLNLPLMVLREFLFGAFWSIPAMLLTSIFNNKYIILCIPFFLKYGLTQLSQKLTDNLLNSEQIDIDMMNLVNATNPDGILWVYDGTRLMVWLVFGTLAALMFAAFIIISGKRVDCGG